MPKYNKSAVSLELLTTQMEEAKKPNKLYKAQADEYRNEALSYAVKGLRSTLDAVYSRGYVDLSNIEELKEQTNVYLEACEATSTIPTVMGLASALGITRMTLYRYIEQHNDESAQFLDTVRTAFASLLAEQSLKRNIDPITSIFLLKNSAQGLQNEVTINAGTLGREREMSEEELLRQAELLPNIEAEP